LDFTTWISKNLEKRNVSADGVNLCIEKLAEQEVNDMELFSSLEEVEFTSEFLIEAGIEKLGLRRILLLLHRFARKVRNGSNDGLFKK
jgi:hypothetical protein